MDDLKSRAEQARRERNARLAELAKNGKDAPPLVDRSQLFFPPRPTIKKDHEAIRKMFATSETKGLDG